MHVVMAQMIVLKIKLIDSFMLLIFLVDFFNKNKFTTGISLNTIHLESIGNCIKNKDVFLPILIFVKVVNRYILFLNYRVFFS